MRKSPSIGASGKAVDLKVEIFTYKARIAALKQRIVDQQEFVERCQQRQRSTHWKTQGLIPANTYDSIMVQIVGGKYKKKGKTRRKADVWHNFFCWSDPAMFPYTIIKDAEERIARLEIRLQELEKEQDNE
jgi:hypothetical protein